MSTSIGDEPLVKLNLTERDRELLNLKDNRNVFNKIELEKIFKNASYKLSFMEIKEASYWKLSNMLVRGVYYVDFRYASENAKLHWETHEMRQCIMKVQKAIEVLKNCQQK